ncbi:MAG: DUF1232 domain-containing protein [Clostridium sp.]|nr:DUF1232 domain-containing protein [Clostridium sp.]
MNISKVQIQLDSSDILSIINEFVDVDGLEFNTINIDNKISLEGCYKNNIKVNFNANLVLEGIVDGKIYIKLAKVNFMKLGIFRFIRSFALKKAFEFIKVDGINSKKDLIEIDLEKVLKDVPFIELIPKDIYIRDKYVYAEVENINISIKGELVKEKEDIIEEDKENETIQYPVNKVKDTYYNGRNIIKDKLPEELKGVSNIVFILPDLTALIYRLLKDKRVPFKTKMAVSASIAYIMFPIDIIPDNIPLIGKIDDLAVIIFALNRISEDVPIQVIAENWNGKDEFITVLKSIIDYLINFTNAKNVEKLYNMVEELSTL